MRLTLCLLTWNELAGCKVDVPLIPRNDFDEIFAVDGGSTDGTCDYLHEMGIQVYQQTIRGYNGAYIEAFRRCGTDAVVFFHPKGCINPDELRRFRPLLDSGNDVVIASRLIKGARNEEDGRLIKPRKWFVQILALAASIIWRRSGPIIWDVLQGMRAMRSDAFWSIEPLENGLSIDLEIVVRGYRSGVHMVEFPVAESSRPFGSTHFKAFSTGRRLLMYILSELKRTVPEARK